MIKARLSDHLRERRARSRARFVSGLLFAVVLLVVLVAVVRGAM